nr:putative disease resistance protein RGA4 isoform X2 [Arachis hypogaea]XP_025698022.1 putative disease resistance protein RGA4 isoform X2 [Arachis hypogaea]
MADALLGIVVENLHTFLRDQLATFYGVQSQIQELSSNLTASHAVKDWLNKLSDAAHVLDDMLDECSIKFNALQIPHGNCFSCFNPEMILFRFDIGKRMKAIRDRFLQIDEERRRFELQPGVVERLQEDEEWHQTSSLITEQRIYGRHQDIETIVELLSTGAGDGDGEDLAVYPIVGVGGLGKTTLARWVFNDERVIKHFDFRIWVCVSNDFNMMRILKSIVESATKKNPDLFTLEAMQKRVQEELLGKRCLIVLDDVWNEDQDKWEKLKYTLQCGSGTKGASILVTTRLESVASIMGTCPFHHLLPLSEDENWLLFKHYAFGQEREERAELVTIGKEIVKKCAGSPLASKALGSLLRFRNDVKQWLSVKISKLWDIPEGNAIMGALRISYFNLDLSIRRCFSFCAIYPQDFQIVKEQLIHLWMANGLIKARGNMEIEEVGNEVWDELCQKSFFQDVRTDSLGTITFKMHDLFLELAQSIMGEECVVSKSANLTSLTSRVHHVSCLDFYETLNLNQGALKKAESLRTFINLYPTLSNSRVLPTISSLRALTTSSSKLSALKNLTHLRYLTLYNSSITTLPKSVSRLQKLQILKLEDCDYLSCLPKQLTQLQDLRHLIVKNCESLVALPPKIGNLKRLRTLSTFIVHPKEGFTLAELRDLQLGGKLHIKGLEHVPNECDAKAANLSSKKDLNCLYLSWGSNANLQCNDDEKVLEALEAHSNIKSFGMKGYNGTKMPSWMNNISLLSRLTNVILYDCNNCEQLPALGKLPHLTILFVCGMRDLKYIDDDAYEGAEEKAFKSLKKLTLFQLPNLERVLRDERAEMLPLLSELSISCVPKLKLPHLPSVSHLQIQGLKSVFDYNGITR